MERIICAANYYNDGRTDHAFQPNNVKVGFITCGMRHHNCIHTFAQIVGFPYSDEAQAIHNTEEQGFITTKNRFVDRHEAYKIALEAGQISSVNYNSSHRLHSEDLY